VETIGFVGGGNMAEALIKGILSAQLYRPEQIYVSDIRADRLEYLARTYGIQPAPSNAELAEKADIVVLSVKPQNMPQALASLQNRLTAEKLVISIAAGTTVATITAALGAVPVVRVMPNTPALIGQGASALYANEQARPMLLKAKSIFEAAGTAVVLEDEQLLDAVTAVSGSGPAYFFLLAELMLDGAQQLGLPEDLARQLILQTAKGSALLAVEADRQGQSLAQLRQRVTSPGGTTEAALKVLHDANLPTLIARALQAARDRSRELSR